MWAGLGVHPLGSPCACSAVLQEAPGRDWDVSGVLSVVTVFGSTDGSRWEGAGIVPVPSKKSSSAPSRNIKTRQLTLGQHVFELLGSTYT